MHGFLNDVFVGLLGLTTIANPVTSATVLLALTGRYPVAERNRQITRATIYVTVVLLICFYAGKAVMNVFGISLPGLRLAGGLIVSYIGFGMLFPPARLGEDEAQAEMAAEDQTTQLPDVAFIPLTMPCTTGPGTIAFIISAAATIPERGYDYNVNVAVITITLLFALVFWLCLRGASPLLKLLGEKGVDAMARVMGFLLVCIGVQFAINGIHDLLQAWGFIAAA
ncbi:MarC family NAAT transporter [Dyella sp. EPa41]|uniref:MarC family NAAT transporter n=1 Tax=Dyella sp. EPa41 TaxID=1561194 RepID=UPI001914E14A|nr:MarC family NAAT transporter [Dyella sp. EPa41]